MDKSTNILKFLEFLDDFMLDMSYVDFVFYGAYALVTDYKSGQDISLDYYLSKIIAWMLLSRATMKCVSLLYNSLVSPERMSMLDRKVVEEGINKIIFEDSKLARLINPLFKLRILILLIILALFQTMPFMSLGALVIVQTSCTSILGYITWKVLPFESLINAINFWLIEITISLFLTICLYLYLYEWLLCNFSGQSLNNRVAIAFQKVIAVMLALIILLEVLLFIFTLISTTCKLLCTSSSIKKSTQKKLSLRSRNHLKAKIDITSDSAVKNKRWKPKPRGIRKCIHKPSSDVNKDLNNNADPAKNSVKKISEGCIRRRSR